MREGWWALTNHRKKFISMSIYLYYIHVMNNIKITANCVNLLKSVFFNVRWICKLTLTSTSVSSEFNERDHNSRTMEAPSIVRREISTLTVWLRIGCCSESVFRASTCTSGISVIARLNWNLKKGQVLNYQKSWKYNGGCTMWCSVTDDNVSPISDWMITKTHESTNHEDVINSPNN